MESFIHSLSKHQKDFVQPNANFVWLEGCSYTSSTLSEMVSKNDVYTSRIEDETFISPEKLYSKVQDSDKNKFLDSLSTVGAEQLFSGKCQHPAVGGTFDHLHIGHKIILSMTAYSSARKVTCGISSEPLLKNKKFKESMESFDTRYTNAKDFLNIVKKGLDLNLFPLSDPFGPIITDGDIDTLIVSKETLSGCDKANEIRVGKSMKAMEILPIDLVFEKSTGSRKDAPPISEKISSTEIRRLQSENLQK
ncbi:Phosphopantetheine adenylyltransferase [Smittium culicis]|uniref:Phosphopantetheine adenylyltransferase n=1 Tax=Smittium culicis TaxID=133412 RepID=A0A1R1XZB3_9FUNG|nr:Phosphopantetheine adenylyltransferase [Smittium culicis]